ncbi:MAG: DnaJ domain-containing protein [Bacteroidota bacterium]
MADYYSILGLPKTATEIEIKTAFRRLAKIYHPDKNPNDPNAKHLFEDILRAYNTLSNPHTRKRYDNSGLNAATTHSTRQHRSSGKKQKEWTFTDEDLKRREYFKKHYQAKKQAVSPEPQKTNYSDYKYVLFATPIAVGLLMLIVSIFSSEPQTELIPRKSGPPAIETTNFEVKLVNGDKPYSGFFGNIKTFDTKNYLKINNASNYDAVIAVFDKQTDHYLQHAYLQASYSIEFLKLPETGVYWKSIIGKNWNNNKTFVNNTVSGGFDSIVQYQNWKKQPTLFSSHDNSEDVDLLSIIDPQSKNKQYISNDKMFFEKK